MDKQLLYSALDAQKSIILVYQRDVLVFANRRFFQVFPQFSSLEECTLNHRCVSELFTDIDGQDLSVETFDQNETLMARIKHAEGLITVYQIDTQLIENGKVLTISEVSSTETAMSCNLAHRSLYDNIDVIDTLVMMVRVDEFGRIISASSAFLRLSEFEAVDLIGKPMSIIRRPNMPQRTFTRWWKTIQEDPRWSGELKLRKKDGTLYWVYTAVAPAYVSPSQTKSNGYFFVMEEITGQKEMEQTLIKLYEVRQLSMTDPLTQLYNRYKLNDSITREIERTRRYDVPLSMILIDIDHFKPINDNFGHLVGDQVLVEMSKLLKAHIRTSDILGRWGGEEFIILLPHTVKEHAAAKAESIRCAIEKRVFACGNITASFGVTQFRLSDSEDDFIRRTDDALYEAKGSGRNIVIVV
ncbi:sensor domain-containing diguanylate cyclase [Chrysiogenes arsenatis]|uniref:sensor domain-containing diguanylate cyclase n=1 Tax=Chrysiogenes arsenatis TaxID=309797 RepID=UPI0003FEC567|nr:sensor domain-containing diguanylate cyclase [Chrysiogenes arsenatis]